MEFMWNFKEEKEFLFLMPGFTGNSEMKEANQMVTVKEIAREAGVGVGTASRALTGNGYVAPDKQENILRIAKEMGYINTKKPKKRAEKPRQKMIGVILPDISFPFFASYLKYIEVELDTLGYKTLFCSSMGIAGRTSKMLDLLEEGVLDGLVVSMDVTEHDIARMRKLPVVSYEALLGKDIPVIASDHVQGGRLAAEVLIESGCRQVMILGIRPNSKTVAQRRLWTCKEVLEQAHVQAVVIESNSNFTSLSSTREAVAQYMGIYHRADGIFTADLEALCCVRTAIAKGKNVPQDIKIIGYDGSETALLSTPEITTIVQNAQEIARLTIEVLLKQIRREPVESEYLVPVTLRKGGTT